MNNLIHKLLDSEKLNLSEWEELIRNKDNIDRNELYSLAESVRKQYYSNSVFVRGLIEFSNICKNDCYYCGIRRSNKHIERYRLDKETILECTKLGYELGYRTFVLQSGEDVFYKTKDISDIVYSIKELFPEIAITLSLGEHEKEEYLEWFKNGADRYLLRHETADRFHYQSLHPDEMSFTKRLKCLENLRSIGYQVGMGFMVGSPYQTSKTLAKDMLLIQNFVPHMVGIGPFIPQQDTPFKNYSAGTLTDTLFFISLIRLTLPKVLLPATTALGTIDPLGREKGILAGANVLMPNLSPKDVRDKYLLYDNKICTGDEAAECKNCLGRRLERIKYKIVVDRGDSLIEHPENSLKLD